MRHTWGRLATAGLVVILLTGCLPGAAGPGAESEPGPASSVHESGTDSPLGFGFTVPAGATQIGPLMRFRSEELVAAYADELETALARQAADEAERSLNQAAEEAESESPAPSPTPHNEPRRDTYYLLDERPRPDTVTSFLRVEANPTEVFVALLTQIRQILPDSEVDPSAWTEYCRTEQNRIQRCSVLAEGTASNGHELLVRLVINPGDIASRTAAPGADRHPVAMLTVAAVGDPRQAQVETGRFERTELPEGAEPDLGEDEELIWPQMDVDQPLDEPLLDGSWLLPADTTLLLAGIGPRFAVVYADDGAALEDAGAAWVESHSDAGRVHRDVVEDLNEYATTYTARSAAPGLVARATFIQSGRGNYLVLTYTPGRS